MSTPTCPRCEQPLAKHPAPEGLTFDCPPCGGLALALPVLRRRANHEVVATLWARITRSAVAASTAECACPICRHPMKRLFVAGETVAVEIDVCDRCQFLWLDAGELEAFGQAAPTGRPYSLEVDAAGEHLRRTLRDSRGLAASPASPDLPEWADLLDVVVDGILTVLETTSDW